MRGHLQQMCLRFLEDDDCVEDPGEERVIVQLPTLIRLFEQVSAVIVLQLVDLGPSVSSTSSVPSAEGSSAEAEGAAVRSGIVARTTASWSRFA